MIQCSACGASNPPTNLVCANCGASPLRAFVPGEVISSPGGYAPSGNMPSGNVPPAYPAAPGYPAQGYPNPGYPNPGYAAPPPGQSQPGYAAGPYQVPSARAIPEAFAATAAAGPEEAARYRPDPHAQTPRPLGHVAMGAPASEPTVPHNEPLPPPPSSSQRELIGFMVSYHSNPHGRYFEIRAGVNRIGRHGGAKGLDIEIDDPTISSVHAVLTADPETRFVRLEDAESSNGTLLNNYSIAGQGPREVRDGDLVRFGAFGAVVKIVPRA